MTPDQERWAEALAVERLHGARAPVWIAERIGALALAGDTAGVARFRQIAAKLGSIQRASRDG
jgi:hypothetical protein